MKNTSQYIVRGKVQRELEELKGLVGQFLEAIAYVPFRAVDCDQDEVGELWEKLQDAIEDKKNDRKRTD